VCETRDIRGQAESQGGLLHPQEWQLWPEGQEVAPYRFRPCPVPDRETGREGIDHTLVPRSDQDAVPNRREHSGREAVRPRMLEPPIGHQAAAQGAQWVTRTRPALPAPIEGPATVEGCAFPPASA
jgi:hypothetical protein